jgi:hypothetical protein
MSGDTFLLGGHAAGRIRPAGWTPPGGSWAFLFGVELNGTEEDVEINEETSIEQDVDLTAVDLISFGFRFRQTSTPAASFRASIYVDGSERWHEEIAVGAAVEFDARVLNVSGDTGVKTLKAALMRTA